MNSVRTYCAVCGDEPGEGIASMVAHMSNEHPDISWTYRYVPGAFPIWIGVEDDSVDEDDPVDHPSHYTGGTLECIDWIGEFLDEAEMDGYLKGNVLKYLWRYDAKGKPEQDLRKADWYLNRLISCVADREEDTE